MNKQFPDIQKVTEAKKHYFASYSTRLRSALIYVSVDIITSFNLLVDKSIMDGIIDQLYDHLIKDHNFQSMQIVSKDAEPVIPMIENKFYFLKSIAASERIVDKKGSMSDYIDGLLIRIDEIVK